MKIDLFEYRWPNQLLVFVAIIAMVAAISSRSMAAENALTNERHSFNACMRLKSYGKEKAIYWVPGLFTTCSILRNRSDRSFVRAFKFCNSVARKFKKQVPFPGYCTLAYDGRHVVDERFARALKEGEAYPVSITAYDDATKKIQKYQGKIRRIPTTAWSRKKQIEGFAVSADRGAEICRGTTEIGSPGNLKYVYSAKCFGQTFKGVVRPTKVLEQNGIFLAVPDAIRLKAGQNWLQFEF